MAVLTNECKMKVLGRDGGRGGDEAIHFRFSLRMFIVIASGESGEPFKFTSLSTNINIHINCGAGYKCK